MYRHDLQALLYVLVRITSRFHKGKEVEDPPLESWEGLVTANKFSFLLVPEDLKPTSEIEPFKRLFKGINCPNVCVRICYGKCSKERATFRQ